MVITIDTRYPGGNKNVSSFFGCTFFRGAFGTSRKLITKVVKLIKNPRNGGMRDRCRSLLDYGSAGNSLKSSSQLQLRLLFM